jgi:hypothetical protein
LKAFEIFTKLLLIHDDSLIGRSRFGGDVGFCRGS